MPENEKIQINLSDDTTRALRAAQRRHPNRTVYDHLRDAGWTAVSLASAVLAITLITYAVFWLVDRMPPTP